MRRSAIFLSVFLAASISLYGHTLATGIQAMLSCTNITLNPKSPLYQDERFMRTLKDPRGLLRISIDNFQFAVASPGQDFGPPLPGVIVQPDHILLRLHPIGNLTDRSQLVINRQTLQLRWIIGVNNQDELVLSADCTKVDRKL